MAKQSEIKSTMTPAELRDLASRKKWRVVTLGDQQERDILLVVFPQDLPSYFFRLEGSLFQRIPPASRLKILALKDLHQKCRCMSPVPSLEDALLVDADFEYPSLRRERNLWFRSECAVCNLSTLHTLSLDAGLLTDIDIVRRAKKITRPQSHAAIGRLWCSYHFFWPKYPDAVAVGLESCDPLASVRVTHDTTLRWF